MLSPPSPSSRVLPPLVVHCFDLAAPPVSLVPLRSMRKMTYLSYKSLSAIGGLGGWVISLDLHGSKSPHECPGTCFPVLLTSSAGFSRRWSLSPLRGACRSTPSSDGSVCLDHQFGWTQCPQALSRARAGTVGCRAARPRVHLCQEGHGALSTRLHSRIVVWSELALSRGTTRKVTPSIVGLAYHRVVKLRFVCVRCKH